MYSTRADLEAVIPPQFITQALDDNGDGVEDVGLFQKIQTAADQQVDAYLSGRFTTPFGTPVPPLVAEASRIFTSESLYARRGYAGEANPYTPRANKLRSQLQAIGDGNGSLGGIPTTSTTPRPPISVISEPSRTHPTHTLNQ